MQRFSIAPANESYIISILRFLGLIDEEGNKVEGTMDYFFGTTRLSRQGSRRFCALRTAALR